MGTEPESDFGAFVRARWAGLVDMLVDAGVDRPEAEEVVADVLVRLRRGWSHLRDEEDVDRLVPELVRERAGVAGTGLAEAAPPLEGVDVASHLRAAERRRRRGRVRRAAAAVLLAVVLVAAVGWWLARPVSPEVERADNPVPVPWYAEGRLHLADVVVTLPGVVRFAPAADGGVVVRDASGRARLVAADGDVEALDRVPEALAEPAAAPEASAYLRLRDGLRVLDVAQAPDGRLVHVVELDSDPATAGGFVRLSESGRHGLVVCDAGGCGDLLAVVAEGEGLRLR